MQVTKWLAAVWLVRDNHLKSFLLGGELSETVHILFIQAGTLIHWQRSLHRKLCVAHSRLLGEFHRLEDQRELLLLVVLISVRSAARFDFVADWRACGRDIR